MAELLNIANGKNKKSDISYLNDDIFLDYYSTFYNDMSSKELDSDFNRELRVLVQSMSKMNESERKAFLNVLSMVIGHYIEQKIDKELDFSFKKNLQIIMADNENDDPQSQKEATKKENDTDFIPAEILESIPVEERGKIVSVIKQSMFSSISRRGNPIADKITTEHITQIISRSDDQDKRDREERKSQRNYNLILIIIGLVFIGFLIIFLQRDKELLIKIIVAIYHLLVASAWASQPRKRGLNSNPQEFVCNSMDFRLNNSALLFFITVIRDLMKLQDILQHRSLRTFIDAFFQMLNTFMKPQKINALKIKIKPLKAT